MQQNQHDSVDYRKLAEELATYIVAQWLGGRWRTFAERFWANVHVTDGCWLWTGYVNPTGYGGFRMNGTKISHRVAWELTHGPIPDGMQVCHRCDVPLCVRPDHLFLGTNADNIHDCVEKGRHNRPKGEHHHRARLTEATVREARALHAAGVGADELGKRYGVHPTTVLSAVKRQTWGHVA